MRSTAFLCFLIKENESPVSYEKGFVKLTDKFYKTSTYNRAFLICGTYYF